MQLPGVTDVARAKEIIRSTALLELKLVEAGPAPTQEALLQSLRRQGAARHGDRVRVGAVGGDAGTCSTWCARSPAVTGRDLRNAKPSLDENNRPAVSFSLKNEGARKFGKVDRREHRQATWRSCSTTASCSAPRIDGRITDEGRISGNFTPQEVADLSLTLRSGALPASLTYLEERVDRPVARRRLDPLRRARLARRPRARRRLHARLLQGCRASTRSSRCMFNLVILLGLMAYFGATMTLPGIAGFVLTMGIGVDSNVLIFERIKEELAAQRGVRAAINAGFDRVFLTLLDTHVASLIAAAFLFQFGTGPIRGFAMTLTIGLLSNLFTSIFVSKTLFEAELAQRQTPVAQHLRADSCRSSRHRISTSSAGAGTPSRCRGSSSSPASSS